jgi:hypothetical protein
LIGNRPRDIAHLTSSLWRMERSTPDWPVLRAALAARHAVVAERPGWLKLDAGDGQRLTVELAQGMRGDWLVLAASICSVERMDGMLTLERSARLALSSLVAAGGQYWLRMAVPLDSAELGDVGELASLCLSAARSLSPAGATAAMVCPEMFTHYV